MLTDTILIFRFHSKRTLTLFLVLRLGTGRREKQIDGRGDYEQERHEAVGR